MLAVDLMGQIYSPVAVFVDCVNLIITDLKLIITVFGFQPLMHAVTYMGVPPALLFTSIE